MTAIKGKPTATSAPSRSTEDGDAWWEVVAYARRGKKSGFNRFALANATDAVMCNACMLRAKMQAEHGPVGGSLF